MTYTVPGVEVLGGLVDETIVVDSIAIDQRITKLQNVLNQFGVKATVVEAKTGPVVTRFEIELAVGVKSASITKLDRDIARCMSVSSVRVLDIIAGSDRVGIEVANVERKTVSLTNLIDSEQFRTCSGIPVVMGADIVGNPIIIDLAKTPHMLIAGTTGCGKSVTVNSMLISMLCKFNPSELQMILIDPKMLELSNYNGIDHLYTDVVTDMDDAVDVLDEVIEMMDDRYEAMAGVGVRNINEYNARVKAGTVEDDLMPYVVVVIDEFADLIMTNKEVEGSIMRLSQKSRAAGIHLIIATQRPSSDVITGVIKANIPTRVALTVASKMDSRIIIDESGAEVLLGNGDMLMSLPGKELTRVHGCFVSNDQIDAVIDSIRVQQDAHQPAPYVTTLNSVSSNPVRQQTVSQFPDHLFDGVDQSEYHDHDQDDDETDIGLVDLVLNSLDDKLVKAAQSATPVTTFINSFIR